MANLNLKNVGEIQIGEVDLKKVNWKQKLSSRKFWIGMILLICGIVLGIMGDVENGVIIAAIGGGAYMGLETIVDVMRIIFENMKVLEEEYEEVESDE